MNQHAKIIARELKKTHKTNDVEEIASKYAFIQYGDLVNRIGMTLKINDCPVIIIDKKISKPKSLFVIAHELGHILLHPFKNQSHMKRYTALSVDKDEKAVNTFAFELLFGHLTADDYEDSYSITEFINEYDFEDEIVKCFITTPFF